MRINIRPDFLVAVLLLALLVWVLPAAMAAPESDGAGTGASEEGPSVSSTVDPDKKNAEGDAKTSPLDPFIPTETISADSAISFPVDI